MVILLSALLGVLIAGFLIYPFWTARVPASYPQELLDRIHGEIEDEIRALRTDPGEQPYE